MESPTVRSIMQTKVVTVSDEDSLSTVEDIMTLGHVRHMPVVSCGKLVGVVSERDLLRVSLSNLTDFGSAARKAFLHVVELKRVMSAPPVTVRANETVRTAARIMAERKIGCLPVVSEGSGELVGLVTETDVLRHFAALPER